MLRAIPTLPRARPSVWVVALAIAVMGGAIAIRTTTTSIAWIDRVFPGFVLLDNRVVASVGLAHWSGTTVPDLYQSEVLAVQGRRVHSRPAAYAAVHEHPAGTGIRYLLQRNGARREIDIESQLFGLRDWLLLHGVFLLNGLVFLVAGLATYVLRPESRAARALLAGGGSIALFLFTAMDLYGPATFFRLHVLAESFVPATMLHFGLVFPEEHRWARLRFVGYALSIVVALSYEVFLDSPADYSRILNGNMLYVGLVAVFFCSRLVQTYARSDSQLVRQRVRVILVGALFGFGVPAVVLTLGALMGGDISMNIAALTPFIFAVSLAYAVVQHDLFEIDAMVKRGAYYLVLTGMISLAYVSAVLAFDFGLRAGAVTDSTAFPVLFALAVLLLFNPLRTRVQGFVDRVFFGTDYDSGRVLTEVGRELAQARQRDQIAQLVRGWITRTLANEGTRLFVVEATGPALHEIGGAGVVPAAVVEGLDAGRVLTSFDPPESYPDQASFAATRTALTSLGATIAVPMEAHGALVGAVMAGPKRSRLVYTADDAQLLRALAQQTAIALQHAAAYDALVDLNASLEQRVRTRTAELEDANRDLEEALRELQAAEAQLVQSEKMASLGRLVAGVAHEINNPVSFIANSVAPLRRRLAKAADAPSAESATLLREAEDLVGIMAKGAERAAAIVKDLRTFSRLDEATRKPLDVRESLEVSLRLLEHRWRDRITVHRNYGDLPALEGDPGQINQVFLNVLGNACDAIADASGNVWITTEADDGSVRIAIRDDGPGIPADLQSRIFDPFFTTKDVGAGTGLGLSISHGIVAAHGGRIEVESAPGHGALFTIVLPARSLDSAACGSR
jgi:signal transduction histidine kinase